MAEMNDCQCCICGKIAPNNKMEAWVTNEGDVVEVGYTGEIFAAFDTSNEELYVCEACYKLGVFSAIKYFEVYELHYQFGLEFRDNCRYEESVQSLKKAYRCKRTADALSSIAFVHGELGNRVLERMFYLGALKIDPSHFMALANLRGQ
jgi:hypothetical protein